MPERKRDERETEETILPLIREIRDLVQNARQVAAQNVNTIQVVTNFEIGRRIVEHEQQGSPKAGYGKRVIQELSRQLTDEFGRGFSSTNLKYMRQFYLEYREPRSPIAQKPSARSLTLVRQEAPNGQTLSDQFGLRFTLSWSHYVFLMNIGDRDERRFYEIEAEQNRWSLSELKRQFNTGLYERLALSRDKIGVKALAHKGQIIERPQDMLKDPYILEFLGLDEKARYSVWICKGGVLTQYYYYLA